MYELNDWMKKNIEYKTKKWWGVCKNERKSANILWQLLKLTYIMCKSCQRD